MEQERLEIINKRAVSILSELSKGNLSIETAKRKLFVVFEVSQNANCKLDRFPKDCSIFRYTSFKECHTCGHFYKLEK